jgi:ribosomal protein S18 acetylase RimI-like enzyme
MIWTLWAADPEALLVAEADGWAVGALVAGRDGWRGNLDRLAVRPEARRRGLEVALVRAGEERLRAKGAVTNR